MRAIEIGGNHGFLIVGLRRADSSVIVNPGDDEILREGDTVIVLGHANDLPELRRRYELERTTYYRGRSRGLNGGFGSRAGTGARPDP